MTDSNMKLKVLKSREILPSNFREKVSCKECDWKGHYLTQHLEERHNLTPQEYLKRYPDSPLMSRSLKKLLQKATSGILRTPVTDLQDIKANFAGLQIKVPWDVPAEDCLPLPEFFRFPQHGELFKDFREAAISLISGRSLYIWGLPGSGKDALIHAFSALARRPAEAFSVRTGEDIQPWFFSRSFNQEGTFWEEGRLLQIARDGYLTKSGRRIPYLILISDIDRADKTQMECLRLVLDSIQPRIKGPKGITYPIFPGTQFVATANSSGSGDFRGRCISSNPIDASMLDRFERSYQFHWMLWADEEPIVKEKFPLLFEKSPEAFREVGLLTMTLRKAIESEDLLYAEFSHRAVCAWLGHAEDIVRLTNSVPDNLVQRAARCWLDKLPDPETKKIAERLTDPSIASGMESHGDTSHIREGAWR
jgi:MoxR-like ATPase